MVLEVKNAFSSKKRARERERASELELPQWDLSLHAHCSHVVGLRNDTLMLWLKCEPDLTQTSQDFHKNWRFIIGR